jgi:hypothetical protein
MWFDMVGFQIRQDDRGEMPIDGLVDIINIRRIHIVRGVVNWLPRWMPMDDREGRLPVVGRVCLCPIPRER